MNTNLFSSSKCLVLLLLSLISGTYAKPIPLYEQPQNNSKLITNINSDQGITTIFHPKNSEWIKVADPQNGNVGWTKVENLKSISTMFNLTRTQQGQHTYQVIHYGNTKSYTNEEIEREIKQMQARYQLLQKQMRLMIDDIGKMQYDWQMIMPVIIFNQPPQHTQTLDQPSQNSSAKK